MSEPALTASLTDLPERTSSTLRFVQRLLSEQPLGTVAAGIVLVFVFVAVFADVLAPYDYAEPNLPSRLEGPSLDHPLGADQLGRDVLSRVIEGARISLIVGFAAAFINVIVAVIIGSVSGYFGGRVDMVIQRIVDGWMAIPGLLILLVVMSFLGRGMFNIILVLGIAGGIGGSRLARSAVIAIKDSLYLTAARTVGVPTSRILTHHVLPNIMAPMIILFSASVGGNILSEATLSFLGFGLPPDIPSWGGMLSGEGRKFMEIAPHLALWPGLALTIVVWGTNMFGDSLRDLLDPRMRGGNRGYL
ncbi:MAG: ABC transporter permease [Gammaproteobacteria bacterium]|nr:ABC transporter permease [Gammaproteobacteria bacterium]RPG26706.1 MAG: ABC transporter permease [Gammaproteobacteria bacterium TMED50]